MMGGLKGGEGELAADGGGAGPLAVSHSAQLEKKTTIFRATVQKNYFKAHLQSWKNYVQGQCRYGEAYF